MDSELTAMSSIASALDTLEDQQTRDRVIQWATSKYASSAPSCLEEAPIKQESPSQARYTNFVDLYDKAKPNSRLESALTAGYWLQVINNNDNWNSFHTNKLLKDLGYGINGISKVFAHAQKQSPVLVRQTSKSGKTQQAKKTYKLTQAGISVVEKMINGQ